MRVLVYKRTHTDDPNKDGIFGIYDCLGEFRRRDFDSVIAIGATGKMAQKCEIDRRVNWIGVGAKKLAAKCGRGPLIKFDKFLLLDDEERVGTPKALAARFYGPNPARSAIYEFESGEQPEIENLLKRATRDGKPSRVTRQTTICRPGTKKCPAKKC